MRIGKRRGIATLVGLILTIPVLFILAVLVTSVCVSLYHATVVQHALGAAIRQISIPLSAEYGCNQARQVIEDVFNAYGVTPPSPDDITIRYIAGSADGARDGKILIRIRYFIPVGSGLSTFLAQRTPVEYHYILPIERYNARYINAWTTCN